MDTERQEKYRPNLETFAAQMVEDGFSDDEVKAVLNTMAPALVSYDRKYPDASAEDIVAIIEKIGKGVSETHARVARASISPNSRETRATRAKNVAELIERNHLHLAYLREPWAPSGWMNSVPSFNWEFQSETEDDTEDELPPPTPMPDPDKGDKVGVVAFKYHVSHENQLFIEYAISFCSRKDRFESLRGKELAVDRFLAGKTLRIEVGRNALFGPIVGNQAHLIIDYADKVMGANGVSREVSTWL